MRRASAPLAPAIALLWLLCALAFALPAAAQPRVWLDRNQIALDDMVTLNMEVDSRSTFTMPNLINLTRDFRIVDHGMERKLTMDNGDVLLTVTMRVALSPLRQGTIEIPSLWSGRNATVPLRLTVLPPRNPMVVEEPPAAAGAPGRPEDKFQDKPKDQLQDKRQGINPLGKVQDQPSRPQQDPRQAPQQKPPENLQPQNMPPDPADRKAHEQAQREADR